MFCQACGATNDGDARFCNMCGTAIAKPGTPGGIVADGTAKGIGQKMPAAAAGDGSAQPAAEPSGGAPAGSAQGVWDQGGGASAPGRSYGGGLASVGNETLAGIGVKSSGRAWMVIAGVAVVLIALGGLGGALLTGDDAPVEEDYDPEVEGHQAEIGLPLPEGVDFPEDDATGDGDPARPIAGPESGAGSAAVARPAGGMGSGDPPPTTTVGTGSGSAGSTGMQAGTGSSTATNTGTTMSTGSTGGTTMSTGSSTGSNTGSGTGSSTGTGTATAMGGDTTTGTGTGTGSNTIPDELPEERDIAMEMYSQRVRFVIARYYAARAQTCFDLATRNSPELSGEVRIRLTIGTEGEVTETSAVRNTTGNEALGQCLAARVRSWRLPPPPGGELTMVLPFRN